jgi:hypothetical protein
MRNIEEYRNTNNSSVYKKARKEYLATAKAKIHCSYCSYHRGENKTKYYGGSLPEGFEKGWGMQYPSWKLASKNRKQWMAKDKVEVSARESYNGGTYIEFDLRKKGKKYKKTNFKDLWQLEKSTW